MVKRLRIPFFTNSAFVEHPQYLLCQLKLRTPHLYWLWQDKLIFHAIFTSPNKSMMPSIASAASLPPLSKLGQNLAKLH